MKGFATSCQEDASFGIAGNVRFARGSLNNRNHRREKKQHQYWIMPCRRKVAIIALLFVMFCALGPAQDQAQESANVTRQKAKHNRKRARTLDSDERLAVLASALDSKILRYGESDCSHLVHAIYEHAGFPYQYASSDDLYDGVKGFERVSKPEPGDLVVWRGHAGIVVRPSQHVFYSFLHAGPGIDDYLSRYWRGKGEARFYRYVKNSPCAGCTLARKAE